MENRRHWKGRCASDWRGVCACTVCVEQNLRREREIHVVPLCGYMNFGVDVAKNRATKYLRYLRYCERLQSLGKTCAVRGLAAERAVVTWNMCKATIPFWIFLFWKKLKSSSLKMLICSNSKNGSPHGELQMNKSLNNINFDKHGTKCFLKKKSRHEISYLKVTSPQHYCRSLQ